jgi:hypothetical protein
MGLGTVSQRYRIATLSVDSYTWSRGQQPINLCLGQFTQILMLTGPPMRWQITEERMHRGSR